MDDELQTASVPQTVFEFTRRKRWADVLVSELVGVAILVLSHTGTIIHTDAAVHAVTGYAEDQLIGKNFSDIIHEGDALSFFQAFEDAVAANLELTFYLRIRALDRRDSTIRLVELKANPFREPGTSQCFAVSDLDDFVALKTENEQLVQRIEALRNGNDNWTDGAFESDLGETSSEEGTALHGPSENIVDKSERALAQVSAALGAAAAAAAVANNQGVDGNAAVSSDGPTKKKRRLTESTQGRICTACGRNNSPEWRKGPQGPKTLCNACGLRYAKTISGKGRADTAVAE